MTAPIAASIPADLKSFDHWVTWSYARTAKGELTKIPFQAGKSECASVTDPTTWSSFDDAVNGMQGRDGIGWVVTKDTGVTLVDLDDTGDSDIAIWAQRILERVPSYAERTPGGAGIHSIVKAVLPDGGCKRGCVEMYSEKRFFTVTGDLIVGARATVEPVEIAWLHRLMIGGVFNFEVHDGLRRLMNGDWQSSYPSQSEADLALCSVLAWPKLSPEDIDCAFRLSGLYREKWDAPRGASTYGDTIAKAMGSQSGQKVLSAGTQRQKSELPTLTLPPLEKENFTESPAITLEGDYIADLTHALSDGTAIPPQFVREEIVLLLGALADGRLSYPGHDLSTRRYLSAISEMPASGKGESHKRTTGTPGQPTFLGRTLTERGIKLMDGGLIGSGQYLAHVVEESPRAIIHWDELSELLEKASQQASTLLSSLKKLFEGNVHWSGSFTNKKHGSDDVHLSVLLHATRPSFTRMFTGKGSVGDGLLSRFTLVYAPGLSGVPEWRPRNYREEDRLAALLVSRVPDQLLVPGIDEAARSRMNDFLIELRRATHPHAEYVQRLDTLTKIDLLHRAVYSSNSHPRITVEAVDRSIAWAEHQLRLRLGLWVPDSGNRVEAMTQTVLRRLKKGPATENDLKGAANVFRDGSHETFNRVMNALHRSSEIVAIGQTHKRTIVFALAEQDDKPAGAP